VYVCASFTSLSSAFWILTIFYCGENFPLDFVRSILDTGDLLLLDNKPILCVCECTHSTMDYSTENG
jgi:hypothetical protein